MNLLDPHKALINSLSVVFGRGATELLGREGSPEPETVVHRPDLGLALWW